MTSTSASASNGATVAVKTARTVPTVDASLVCLFVGKVNTLVKLGALASEICAGNKVSKQSFAFDAEQTVVNPFTGQVTTKTVPVSAKPADVAAIQQVVAEGIAYLAGNPEFAFSVATHAGIATDTLLQSVVNSNVRIAEYYRRLNNERAAATITKAEETIANNAERISRTF